MSNVYDSWASIYDSVYSYVRGDIPFYVDLACKTGGPVLELGCGTGRVTIPVSEAGIEITGVDFSKEMVRVARAKTESLISPRKNPNFLIANMCAFDLDRKYKLVIIPFRGFLSLLTVEDQIATLNNIKKHLHTDGILAFNIFVPDLEMLTDGGDIPYHFRDVTDPKTGSRYVLWHQSNYDNHSQIIDSRIIIESLDMDGVVEKRLYRDFQMRYVYRWEMEHLLTAYGFEIISLYGDFAKSPFDNSSNEMIWVTSVKK